MADNEITVRDIQWSRVLQVGHILRAFRIAFWPPSKLLLCLAALVTTIGFGILLDLPWQTRVYDQSLAENFHDVYRASLGYVIEPRDEAGAQRYQRILEQRLRYAPESEHDQVRRAVEIAENGTQYLIVSPPENTREIFGLALVSRGFWYAPLEAVRHLVRLIAAYWTHYWLFALLNTVVALLTWTFFGGAVCRLAALQFSRDERPGMIAALKFTAARYASLVMSPLAMFIVMAIIGLAVFFVAGVVLWIPFVGELLMGLFILLALMIGVVLALLFLFGVAGLGLQMPAIAAEGRDAFDAVSRGVNYVFTRPWRYILYTAFSLLILSLSFVLVRLFTLLALKIPYLAISIWPWIGRGDTTDDGQPVLSKLGRIWAEPSLSQFYRWPAPDGGTEHLAAILISIGVWLLVGLMLAFIPSFILTSQTIIYFLLRRLIDFKSSEEVYVGEEEDMVVRLDKMLTTTVENEPASDDAGAGEDEKPADKLTDDPTDKPPENS